MDDDIYNVDKYPLLTLEYVKYLYLQKQCSKEVARLLSLEPEFNWKMITQIELNALNIIHIVSLRLLSNLKHLSLAQNNIRKIENLNYLTKLEHLDLSYNKITKITNLEKLTAITFLSLAGNNISELNNLDELSQLQTFFICDNMISDINQIIYLQRFKELKFLDVLNNPANIKNSRQQIIDILPNLKYLNSIYVTDLERKFINASDDANSLKNNNSLDISQESVNLKDAFLYDTDGKQFILHMHNEDDDGKILCKWNITVQRSFEKYKKNISKHAINLCNTSLEKYACFY